MWTHEGIGVLACNVGPYNLGPYGPTSQTSTHLFRSIHSTAVWNAQSQIFIDQVWNLNIANLAQTGGTKLHTSFPQVHPEYAAFGYEASPPHTLRKYLITKLYINCSWSLWFMNVVYLSLTPLIKKNETGLLVAWQAFARYGTKRDNSQRWCLVPIQESLASTFMNFQAFNVLFFLTVLEKWRCEIGKKLPFFLSYLGLVPCEHAW